MYAEIVLPLPMGEEKSTLTYKVPMHFQNHIRIGKTVEVPIKNRMHTGIVAELHEREIAFIAKEILNIQEGNALLSQWQMELAIWISKHYHTPLYKAFQLMLPKKLWKTKANQPRSATLAPMIGEKIKIDEDQTKTSTKDQQHTIDGIWNSNEKKFLIRGVTGSGKTEIYLQLALRIANQGKQTILLVPEISLTPQLIHYFKKSFGSRMAILHSRRSLGERESEWKKIHDNEVDLIIGSRSALFAPVQNLGMVILDEEHENSYKQETSPRYHAREVAFKMSEQTGAKIILGSATPSLESHYAAEQGELKAFVLKKRVESFQSMPKAHIVDLREELKKRNFSIFSDLLIEKLTATLKKKQQAILFLNRRGNATAILCRECGHRCICKACEVSLTHHRLTNGTERLVCHHCGRVERVPETCPSCKGIAIKTIGIGTQRIENELQKLFPTARILRADRDTTSKKESFEKLYHSFKNEEADILIGTQMIGKGLDLPKVTLVGVILADVGLHIPDFRSTEKNFQLLTQVAGRAGRATEIGEVVIQTYTPEHASIRWAAHHDYDSFYNEEIQIRQEFKNPPFSRIIKMTFTHKDQKMCSKEALEVYEKLKTNEPRENEKIQNEISVAPALIPKKQNTYRWNIFIQGDDPRSALQSILPLKRGWSIDVDPITMG